MSSGNPELEIKIREEVASSERALEALEEELRAAEGALEELAQQRHQYELLGRICNGLEELEGMGAQRLFWGAEGNADTAAAQLSKARAKMDEFQGVVAGAEARRDDIVARIGKQNESLDYLHYDLQEAIEAEEGRQSEWAVERDAHDVPYRTQVMPWSRSCEEDRQYRRAVAASVLWFTLGALLIRLVELPILDRAELIEVPERVVKLIEREIRPPEPVEAPIIPQPLPEPEPELVEEQPPEVLPEQPLVAEVEQPSTKEQVKTKGILAFRDSFANRASLNPTAQLGSQARVRSAGENAIGRPERSMVTTSAAGSSGGINLADLSRDVGGGGQAIEGVAVTRVASSIGGEGGADRPLAGGGALAGRTDEEIQIVFDRYKAALYRLYNRELRKDPTLRGQIVLRLTIEPDGSVSLCNLHSSDMSAPLLAEQVVERVLTFDFGNKEGIVAMTIIYPIDFLPAA
ncbi:MAG TPA: AgmX/PglI C-terminal domain-containing protein [Woeseiaceae bacterium]|nr:AgmX/PglI C-terminal domain-containing protein [Woeseiaceae bacterium]